MMFLWLTGSREVFIYVYFWHRFSHQILDCTEVHVRDGAVPLQVALIQQPLDLLVFQAPTKVLNLEKSVSYEIVCHKKTTSVTKALFQVNCCPTCRKYIVGRFVNHCHVEESQLSRKACSTWSWSWSCLSRSTIAEKLARVIYCTEENQG